MVNDEQFSPQMAQFNRMFVLLPVALFFASFAWASPDAEAEATPEADPLFFGGRGRNKCYGKTQVIQKYITKYKKVNFFSIHPRY